MLGGLVADGYCMWMMVSRRGSMPARFRLRVLGEMSRGTCVPDRLSCRIQPNFRVASKARPVSATYPAGTAALAGWKLIFAIGVRVNPAEDTSMVSGAGWPSVGAHAR